MNKPMYSNGGLVPKVADTHVVALYHPDGKIAHVHSVTIFEGGRAVDEKEAIETAKKLARKAGHSVDKLGVKVSKNLMHGRRPHRIDIKSKEFVAVAMPKRTKSAAKAS
jgi:hypothetical protein